MRHSSGWRLLSSAVGPAARRAGWRCTRPLRRAPRLIVIIAIGEPWSRSASARERSPGGVTRQRRSGSSSRRRSLAYSTPTIRAERLLCRPKGRAASNCTRYLHPSPSADGRRSCSCVRMNQLAHHDESSVPAVALASARPLPLPTQACARGSGPPGGGRLVGPPARRWFQSRWLSPRSRRCRCSRRSGWGSTRTSSSGGAKREQRRVCRPPVARVNAMEPVRVRELLEQ